MHLESRVTDSKGGLVATATSSFAVIDEAPTNALDKTQLAP